MDLLTHAKQERDRLSRELARVDKVIGALQDGAVKHESKVNPSSKAYWTPARRKQMSDKIKAFQRTKKKAAQSEK